MWRGNLINAIKITPESAIKFFVWDAAKSFIYSTPNDPSQVTALERLAAGSIAGVAAQAVIFPLAVVKVRRGRVGEGKSGNAHCLCSYRRPAGRRGKRGSTAGYGAVQGRSTPSKDCAVFIEGQWVLEAELGIESQNLLPAPSLSHSLTPAMLGVIPYAGIDLTVYETLKTVGLAGQVI